MSRTPPRLARLAQLYDDAPRCAELSGLRYVRDDEPGLRRRRCGRGFSYCDADGLPVDAATRTRLASLAIPPAWRDVWISPDAHAHLLATGVDDRGRKQYLYHEKWRALRDLVNFYRIIDVGYRLPAVRADVEAQLRRRTLDRDVVLAVMLRIVDRSGLRIGNEEYAEDNDSIGLCTLGRRHVEVRGTQVRLRFPAKAGQHADIVVTDRAVARVVAQLSQQRGRRLFTVSGCAVSAEDVNARLAELTDGRVTAKDFRTWRGTLVAFRELCDAECPGDAAALLAIDAAAEALGNTRAVARAHYVHPHLVEAYLDGSLPVLLATRSVPRLPGLSTDEQRLLGVLTALFDRVAIAADRPSLKAAGTK